MSFSIVLFTLIYAIINGSLEELFWRYTFNKNFKDSIYFTYLLPTIIFTCWHIALCFAKGVTYHGGALALVGGAGFMGLLWGYIMYKTKDIKIVMIAHILTNFFAFSHLIVENWG